MPDLTAEELYAQVYELFKTDHPALVALMEEQWPSIRSRSPNDRDAESCRLAMLAVFEAGKERTASVWRARAMARFAAIGWQEGVGAQIMSEAFRQLAFANDEFARGRTLDRIDPSPEAEAIMAEVSLFLDAERPSRRGFGPHQALLRRWIPEKTAFLLLVAGRYDEAIARFEEAAAAAGDNVRGGLRVRAGLAQARYLRALDAGQETTAFAEETAAVAREAEAANEPDVARDTTTNAEVMRRRGRDLVPYEIL